MTEAEMADGSVCDLHHDHDHAVEVTDQKRVSPNFRKAKGVCRWCKGPKSEKRSVAEFCSASCRNAFHNQSKIDGAAIVHMAKRWRRHRKKGDFALLTKMIDDLVRQDKEFGRDYYPDPPTTAYAKTVGTVAYRRKGG
jgi:hypothetical protein